MIVDPLLMGKGQRGPQQEHLLSRIVKGIGKEVEEGNEEGVECRYGVYCAHLRAQGECQFKHRRNHFHFLNLAAPLDCLPDEN